MDHDLRDPAGNTQNNGDPRVVFDSSVHLRRRRIGAATGRGFLSPRLFKYGRPQRPVHCSARLFLPKPPNPSGVSAAGRPLADDAHCWTIDGRAVGNGRDIWIEALESDGEHCVRLSVRGEHGTAASERAIPVVQLASRTATPTLGAQLPCGWIPVVYSLAGIRTRVHDDPSEYLYHQEPLMPMVT
jgi:hypothetical protein